MTLQIGSLFSGIGGLDLAVEAFFNAETVWHSEIDPEPSKVLAARWPGIPNHGDITRIDWADVEPVDILCGGFPCQDLSLTGRRAGMRPGTRSGLWADFKSAIAALRPSVVIIENVRGLLSGCAESDSDLEPCPGCLGITKQHRPVLRALGRVLGDLAELGFDAEWGSLRAADVGAPHGRFRVFVVAYTESVRFERGWPSRERRNGPEDGSHRAPVTLLPTPQAHDEKGGKTPEQVDAMRARGYGVRNLNEVAANKLLPTPTAANPNDGEDLNEWAARRASIKKSGVNGNGFGMPLGVAVRLLPTPTAQDSAASGGERVDDNDAQGNVVGEVAWGDYEPAVRLWESLTRPAPAPTLPDGKNGTHRLSARLPEWMMGYPDGWVTDILDRNPAIRACGNGVSPQQAYAAIGQLWSRVINPMECVA